MHQFLFYNEFIILLYMFRAKLCSSSGGQNCITQHLASSFSAGGRPMTPWWWARLCSKHVEEYNKLIIKQELVHLVGQLLRLYKGCKVKKTSKDTFCSLWRTTQTVPGRYLLARYSLWMVIKRGTTFTPRIFTVITKAHQIYVWI